MRCFFRVEYDGSGFSGWQSQKSALSVQSALESAFTIILRHPVKITGAGRTDAGVHAIGQGAHADFPDNTDIGKLAYSVNAILPHHVAVRDIKIVPSSFHARFSAIERTYEYTMAFRKTPLLYKRAWVINNDIDWPLIQSQVSSLTGRHDFKAFCASKSGVKTTFCTVRHAEISVRGELRVFTISADRFLYRMVRSIVGTLVDIGRKAVKEPIEEIIESKDRSKAGRTAPAWALNLKDVKYTEV